AQGGGRQVARRDFGSGPECRRVRGCREAGCLRDPAGGRPALLRGDQEKGRPHREGAPPHVPQGSAEPQSFSVSSGTILNRSPTRPMSATWKIGASSSLLIAMIVLESFMPARCWIAPEMPTAIYSCGATILPV